MENRNIELRLNSNKLEYRNSDDGKLIIEGLINKTDSFSHELGGVKKFREKISKGAFTRAIERADKIDFLAEHDSKLLLSSTSNRTLNIWEDDKGLNIRAELVPTSYAKDFYELCKSGLVGQASFGFSIIKDSWKKGFDGVNERTVHDLNLFEVSLVKNPAYPQSNLSARNINLVEEVEIKENRDLDMLRKRLQLQKLIYV